jgi:hypothetical protein
MAPAFSRVRFQLSLFDAAGLAAVWVVAVAVVDTVAGVTDGTAVVTAVPRTTFDSDSFRRGARESDVDRVREFDVPD